MMYTTCNLMKPIGQRIREIFKIGLQKDGSYSVVLPPGMITLGATEEPDFALIGRPELTKPPDCKVVRALGAFDLDGGHGLCLAFLLNDHDLIFTALDPALHLIGVLNFPDITTFPAFQLAPRRNKHALAFRTEHRYNHARAEKINPFIVRKQQERKKVPP